MTRPAYVDEIDGMYGRGDVEGVLRRCQELVRESRPEDYPRSAYIREELGRAHYELDDYFSAERYYRQSLEMHREHGHAVSEDSARCMGLLGLLTLWTGRTAEAEAAFCEALMLLDHLPTDQQTSRGYVLIDLAQLHTWEKEYEIAERLLHEAARQQLRNLGYCLDHLAYVFLHLSRVYEGQERMAAANKTMDKAVRFRELHGHEDIHLASLLSARGGLMRRQRQWAAARESYSLALNVLRRVRPQSHWVQRIESRLAKLTEVHQSNLVHAQPYIDGHSGA